MTPQQVHFFDTFGYLVLPGLMKDSIDWITSEFEAVFIDRGIVHDGTKRSCIVPFIDQRERLCTLLDHPRIVGIAASLLGDDFNYMGSDGNYYTGDTGWHRDRKLRESPEYTLGKYLKIAFYLDPVTDKTGALRVVPGSHRPDLVASWEGFDVWHCADLWGIDGSQLPHVALETVPGDIAVFNHELMHSAFGGNAQRRMFTANLCSSAVTDDQIDELKGYIGGNARFWLDSSVGDVMKNTASPERMRHLRQPLENEAHLPALAAKARLEMSEPARG